MNSIADLYLKNQVNANSPEKLVLMLYDGLKRFIDQGIKAIEEKNIEKANQSLTRAQDILLELIAGLNHEAGEITENLYALYEYMHYRLVQANFKKEQEPAQEVLLMVSELRETWAAILREKEKAYSPAPRAAKIAK